MDGIQLRFTGSIQRDDTGECRLWSLWCVDVTKKWIPASEDGRKQHHQSDQYQQLREADINGEVLYEVDLINMVEIVDVWT